MQIVNIKGREILDSRGNPTVEAEVTLENGLVACASVPSGASTGSLEAFELRDKDSSRCHGKGVRQAIKHVTGEIAQHLRGFDIRQQEKIDSALNILDGTKNKSRLGANALLAVSLACARAHALAEKKPLYEILNEGQVMCMPVPFMNIINGGAHADNNLDFQEFMIVPAGADNFAQALEMGMEIFHTLKAILKKAGLVTSVGDEGGFAPNLNANKQALDMLVKAVQDSGYSLGREVFFALDVAASELFREGYYHLPSENKKLNSEQLINYYENLMHDYPIISIEDGLDEKDWQGWQHLTEQLGKKVQLIGDDLFVTNDKLLQQGIEQGIANAILIKLNQIGTLTETQETIRLAQAHHYGCIISHRSGETEDTFIADLAVASGCGQIKTGSLCRTDRVAKYNQLLRIAEKTSLKFAGLGILAKN